MDADRGKRRRDRHGYHVEEAVHHLRRHPNFFSHYHHLSDIFLACFAFKMLLLKFFIALLSCGLVVRSLGLSVRSASSSALASSDDAGLLQDLVTWDEHSIFVRGERILFYSGEFHPFRLPVPALWPDVFAKIKALGYSGVSFYTDWALLEGERGIFNASGIFALEPFFNAAAAAGIYLLARPGPYINAEVSGGGYPGWLQRVPGLLRTNASTYLAATDLYARSIGQIIAKAQITNGGPVILLQPENEYTSPASGIVFPNHEYFAYVEQQFRDAGIVVPFISNDQAPKGYFAPGTGLGAVDIYGYDSYPLGFDCANPTTWPNDSLPTDFETLHLEQSPTTPNSIVEFQGGSFDPWGGSGFSKCTTLLNEEFERVFYKNNFGSGVTVFNIYMTYGGTNWGNLGHPGGYTSYDYGAVIKEDFTVTREKFSEAKLLVNFLRASPAYLTATPGSTENGSYVDTDALNVTPLFGNGSNTNFYVVRHSAYNSLASTEYTLSVSTSVGNVTIPQISVLNSSLTLNGRDAKIHVTDYDVGGINLIYSSAEIFTWEQYKGKKTILVLYGGAGETHEFAVSESLGAPNITLSAAVIKQIGNSTVVQWKVTPTQQVVSFEDLEIFLLWRNDAYNWWTLELPAAAPISNYTSPSKVRAIVKAGYLVRTATIANSSLYLTGDINSTTTLSVVGSPLESNSPIYFNNRLVCSSNVLAYSALNISLPKLSTLSWRSINSLPEIQTSYSDSLWTVCSQTTSNNPLNLTTPTSLYASDYGYNTGSLIYRGHFVAVSSFLMPQLTLTTQGGFAFGHSVFLNSSFLGSWAGTSTSENYTATYNLPLLTPDTPYVLTVIVDHMGLDENGNPGYDLMKAPRGILTYDFSPSPYSQSSISWKMTGNLHGEAYVDKVRGPLNEGAFFAERSGFHLPAPPTATASAAFPWMDISPYEGTTTAGVNFYTTSFALDLPDGYDIPLAFVFANSTSSGSSNTSSSTNSSSSTGSNNSTASAVTQFRAILFVNGYQFGKYVNHIGPQTSFPVPQGIFDYAGTNYIALALWAMDAGGAKLDGFDLVAGHPVMSARGAVELSPMPKWEARAGVY